jgi:hypothetical protein
MKKAAIFSDDHKHRYVLTRIWDESKPLCCFVMLNPSIADDKIDDPTIRRCITFATNWRYGGFYIINIYSYITSNPKNIIEDEKSKHDNICFHRDIMNMKNIRLFVFAWGINKIDKEVVNILINYLKYCGLQPYCIKQNKNGSPAHPLYLKSDLKPILYKEFNNDI